VKKIVVSICLLTGCLVFAAYLNAGSSVPAAPSSGSVPATVSQADAEAGTSTTVKSWTAQRVAQAIAAYLLGGHAAVFESIAVGTTGLTTASGPKHYVMSALTGGAAGALDSIPVAALATGVFAITAKTDGAWYIHIYDSTSAAAESSPDVIAPDDNAGNGRWLLRQTFSSLTLPNGTDAAPTTAAQAYYNTTNKALTIGDGTGAITQTQTIAKGTSALNTAEIASGNHATVVTTSAPGVLSTDVINCNPNADVHGVTGYAPSANGMLTILYYPTADNVNFLVVNNTAGAITPGAVTLNWQVLR